ncbi:hypothetical protein [Streptomyces acidicola]|uniref:hypothetical protein n=1 Tax=Streptomyces acidicola TaxID=2596892 RepID=UPI00188469FD|nr:hypothetical protein [Streptomyces acidicola]
MASGQAPQLRVGRSGSSGGENTDGADDHRRVPAALAVAAVLTAPTHPEPGRHGV